MGLLITGVVVFLVVKYRKPIGEFVGKLDNKSK